MKEDQTDLICYMLVSGKRMLLDRSYVCVKQWRKTIVYYQHKYTGVNCIYIMVRAILKINTHNVLHIKLPMIISLSFHNPVSHFRFG